MSLSRTRDHEVAVTSRIRQYVEYTVNYFFENDRGDFRIDRQYEHAQHVTNAEYGSDIVFCLLYTSREDWYTQPSTQKILKAVEKTESSLIISLTNTKQSSGMRVQIPQKVL